VPTEKDLKRIVRTRLKKTGESYMTARAQVISKSQPKQPPPRAVGLTALAGMSDDKMYTKTGRTWQEWVRVLDAAGAAAMPHGDIALLVNGKHDVDGWWSQTVTVGYERIKCLRDRGQRRGGSYEAGKSRTCEESELRTIPELAGRQPLVTAGEVEIEARRSSASPGAGARRGRGCGRWLTSIPSQGGVPMFHHGPSPRPASFSSPLSCCSSRA
jgi:hypothetical protein